MSGLRFAGVVRRGDFALDLALEVAPGEVVGVLGPNGAGKSTLLRAVAGLESLTGGEIVVAGRRWQGGADWVEPHERRAGVVFQDYRLFPHLSVLDNVAFAPRSRGARRAAARRQAEEWLERLDLADLAARRPHQLSGGQAQRVTIARALASEPDVLLLDEPMAALDAGARLDVRRFLREHLGSFAGPTVLVTHDPLEAMVLTDRMVVVEAGRLVQQGTPGEVAARPVSSYVARLMGLNLWRGRLGDEDDHAVAVAGGGRLVVAPEDLPGTGEVLVSLRPSAISLHRTRPDRAGARNIWPGVVAGMERLGDRVRLQVEAQPAALVDLTTAAVAELRLVAGDEVWLSAKATELEVYAADPV